MPKSDLQHADPALATRTWQQVLEQIIATKSGSTQVRWKTASRDKAFDHLRHRKVIETTSEHFVAVLQAGTVATNFYLRRTHHYALTMHLLPWPVLGKKHWPKLQFKPKRAVTLEEHQKIVARETDLAKRTYYELLWHLGGSQSDIALLTAEHIDWQQKTIAYQRCKTGQWSVITIGDEVAKALKTLPTKGYLFPTIALKRPGERAKTFKDRLKSLGITGITLHSYRYAWAERAKAAGYPDAMPCRHWAMPAKRSTGPMPTRRRLSCRRWKATKPPSAMPRQRSRRCCRRRVGISRPEARRKPVPLVPPDGGCGLEKSESSKTVEVARIDRKQPLLQPSTATRG